MRRLLRWQAKSIIGCERGLDDITIYHLNKYLNVLVLGTGDSCEVGELMAASDAKSTQPITSRDRDVLTTAADIFRLMGDPTRLAILQGCLDAPRAVGELALALGLSVSLVSHHLRLLRAARLVRSHRRGKQVFYEAADHHVSLVVRDMIEHAAEEAGHG